MTPQTELVELRKFIVEHFGEEELKDVCFEMGIDYSDLPSSGRKNKARDLVEQMNREGRVAVLRKQDMVKIGADNLVDFAVPLMRHWIRTYK